MTRHTAALSKKGEKQHTQAQAHTQIDRTHNPSIFISSTLLMRQSANWRHSRKGCQIRLTDNQGLILGEAVGGNLQVQRGGALANTAGDIVVRTVAGAEPAAVVTGLTDGDTTQVGADTCRGGRRVRMLQLCESQVYLPSMTSHSGRWTRSSSGWGSRRPSHLASRASSISPWVR